MKEAIERIMHGATRLAAALSLVGFSSGGKGAA